MKFTVVFHDHIKTSLSTIFNQIGLPTVFVELGVFEGETTFNVAHLLRNNPNYVHYAIDPFLTSENLRQTVLDDAKQVFLENLKEYPSVKFLDMKSLDGLVFLHSMNVKADLIYVDGSHFAKDVLVDAVLGFELLNIGGVMLFDDAVSWRYGDSIHDSPKLAIDNFIQCNWNRLKVLEMPNGYQVAIQRTS